MEKQVEQRLLKPLGIGGRAECPATIKVRRGNNFKCNVVGGRRKAVVEVTQKDDRGNLNFKVTTRP